MSLVQTARELLKYTGARQPMLLVSGEKLDEWMEEAYPLLDNQKQFDGVPFRCVRSMRESLHVIDMAP